MNGEKFSFRAAFLQNEWQKKSAGSMLIGAEFFTGVIKGDSALVPSELSSHYGQQGIYKNTFTQFGPGIGYAYTVVIKQHLFASASLAATADLSFINEYSTSSKQTRTTINPNASFRAVVGYNSDSWISTVSWVNTYNNLRGKASNDQYLLKTGNIRLTLAKRFYPGKKLARRLKIVEKIPVVQGPGQ